MSAVFLGKWEAGSPEWRQHRQGRVGGSDVAAIFGLSPWQSAYALFQERKGLEPLEDNERAKTWGTRLEPVIAQAFQENHPEHTVAHEPGAVYAHPDRGWQVASPDALLVAPATILGGLECKTARHDTEWGPDGSSAIPPYYECQVQWCMDVFGVTEWNVAVLIAGSDYREYVIPANPPFQELLRESAQAFLASLDADIPPDIDGSDHTYKAVRRIHPEIDAEGESHIPPELAEGWINALRGCEEAEAEKRRYAALILDHMGRAKHALHDGRRIAYRQPGPRGSAPFLKQVNGLLKSA